MPVHCQTTVQCDTNHCNQQSQGDHWAWKVMGFRKTKFQAWIVMENNIGRGKSWKVMEKPWKMIFLKEWSPCSHSVMARLPLRRSGHQTFMPHATTRGTAGFDNTYHQLNFKAETNGWVTPILLPLLPYLFTPFFLPSLLLAPYSALKILWLSPRGNFLTSTLLAIAFCVIY